MRPLLIGAAIALPAGLALAACDHSHAGGASITTLKRATGSSGDCYLQIEDTFDTVAMLPDCDATTDQSVTAGLDHLRFIIDYGAEVGISPGTTLPPPTLSVTLDGVPFTTSLPSLGLRQAAANDQTYFFADYDVPSTTARALRMSATIVDGLTADSDVIPVVEPDLRLQVQGCDATGACSRPGDATSTNVVVTLPSRTAQQVTLTSLLDGVTQTTTTSMTVVVNTGVTAFTWPVNRPFVFDDGVHTWTLRAQFQDKLIEQAVTLTRPTATLTTIGCASNGCVGGAQTLETLITIPGDAAQTATLQYIVAGEIVREDSVMTSLGDNHTTLATASFVPPFVDTTTPMTINLRWRQLTASTTVMVQPPAISIAVAECAQQPAGSCSLVGGSTTAHVVVDVPSTTGQQIAVRSFVGGVLKSVTSVTTSVSTASLTQGTADIPIPLVSFDSTWHLDAVWKTIAPSGTSIGLTVPTLGIAFAECSGTGICQRTAGVGTLHATVTLQATTSQNVVVRTFLRTPQTGDVLQSEQSFATQVSGVDGFQSTALTVPTPFAPAGSIFRAHVAWGLLAMDSVDIQLTPPEITAALECGPPPCAPTEGGSVTLVVAAPKDINAATALYSAQALLTQPPATGVISTSTVNELLSRREWRTNLTAPKAGTNWSIDSSVAGFPATTINVIVRAASP